MDFNSWVGDQVSSGALQYNQPDEGPYGHYSVPGSDSGGAFSTNPNADNYFAAENSPLQQFFKTATSGAWGSEGLKYGNPASSGQFFNDLAPVTVNGRRYNRVGEDINAPGWLDKFAQGLKPDAGHYLSQWDLKDIGMMDPQYGGLMDSDKYGEASRLSYANSHDGAVMGENGVGLQIAKMIAMAFGGYMAGGIGAAGEGLGAAAGAAGELGAGASELGSMGLGAAGGGASDLGIEGLMQLANPQMGFTQSLAPEFIGAQTPAFVGPGTTGLGVAAGAGGMNSIEDLLRQLGEGPNAGATESGAMNPAGPATIDNATGQVINGATPDASMKGLMSKLGEGVSPYDLARQGLSTNFGDFGNILSRLSTPSTSSGGMFGNISPLSIAQGAYGLFQSKKLKDQMAQLAQQADPQAPYRAGYASKLNGLVNDPSSITSMPGYQAGLQAVQRSMGAQGYQGSGNMMAALQKYGGDFYNNQVSQLNGLAGGSPSQAAQLGYQGAVDSTNLVGQSLNKIAYGAMGGPNINILNWLKQMSSLGA